MEVDIMDQPSATMQSPEKDMNLVARIWNVFVSPVSTFKAVRVKPMWVAPFIITLVISAVATYFLTPVIMEETREKIIDSMEERDASNEQIESTVERTEKFQKYSIVPSAIIVGAILAFALAGIWLLVTNVLSGGSATYAQVLGASIYAGFIGVLGLLIKMPIILSQRTMNVHFSIATFMSDASQDTFLYKLLAKMDLFAVWGMIVLGIGLAVVGGLKPKKVLPWIVLIYVLYWVVATALSNLSLG
jgi:hypothetical protein